MLGLTTLFDSALSKLFKTQPDLNEADVPEGSGTVDETSWMVESNRDAIEIDIEDMVKNSPIVATALDVVTEQTTIFDEPDKREPLVLSGTERFHEVIDPFVDRVDLMNLVPEITYGTLKYGNLFVEICYEDNNTRIGRLKIFPSPKEIRRNETKEGVLKSGGSGSSNGDAAFEQWRGGTKIASFFPWQMAHFKFGEGPGKKYATPYLAPITKVWTGYRLLRNQVFGLKSELGLVLRVHKVPVPFRADSKETRRIVNLYRQNFGVKKSYTITSSNQLRTLVRGKTPNDIFIPVRYSQDGKMVGADIDIKPQVQGIFDHDEMLFWANHLFTRLRVPPKLLFWDTSRQKIAESGTDPEKTQLVKFSRSLGDVISDGIRSIMEIELFLNGVMPNEDDFKSFVIDMPSSHTTSDLLRARSAALIGQSILMAQQAGVPIKWWLERVVGMNKDEVEELELSEPTGTGDSLLINRIIEEELISNGIPSDFR